MSYDGFNQKVIEPYSKHQIRTLESDLGALPLIYRPDKTWPRANHEASRQVSPSDQGCWNPGRPCYCLKSRKYRWFREWNEDYTTRLVFWSWIILQQLECQNSFNNHITIQLDSLNEASKKWQNFEHCLNMELKGWLLEADHFRGQGFTKTMTTGHSKHLN